MKSSWLNRSLVVALAALAGLYAVQANRAQDPLQDPFSAGTEEAEVEFEAELEQFEHAKRAAADAKRVAAEAKRAYAEAMLTAKVHARAGTDAVSIIREAAEKLRDAEGDDAKSDAEANLRTLLSNYFDEDMERREAELEAIENRVEKLRDQLERRGDHKPDIIDLQVKVLVNEADGLGFFSDRGGPDFLFAPSRVSAPSGDPFWIGPPGWEMPVPVKVSVGDAADLPIAPVAAPAPPAPPAKPRVRERERPRIEAAPSEDSESL